MPMTKFPWPFSRALRSFVITFYLGSKQVPKALDVADTLYCGICKPQPEPIEMPYLS